MATRSGRSLLIAAVVLMVTACGPDGSVSPPTSSPPVSTVPTDEPSSTTSAAAGQTDTEWGRIWDTVPAGFPRYPGAAPADDASAAPASLRYVVSGADPETIAAWLQAGLETATFSTDVSGPLEDGSFALDSVGDAGCRIQTTVAPLGGMTFVTVLYGASCPIP
jgi:hypothetical protein